jgi:hypothetical protein
LLLSSTTGPRPRSKVLKQVDLPTLDHHPQTTLYGLIPVLSCQSCQPSPPLAQLKKLSQYKWASISPKQLLQSFKTAQPDFYDTLEKNPEHKAWWNPLRELGEAADN